MGEAVYLQPVNGCETTLNLYGEDKLVLCYNYTDLECPLGAIEYRYPEGEKQMNSGSFNPAFVLVGLDEDGNIRFITDVKYYMSISMFRVIPKKQITQIIQIIQIIQIRPITPEMRLIFLSELKTAEAGKNMTREILLYMPDGMKHSAVSGAAAEIPVQ